MKTSTDEVSLPVVPKQETERAIDDINDELFHTLIINDQQVTKACGDDAAIDDEEDIKDFNETLDMDTLCGSGGMSYLFDNEPTGNIDGQTHPKGNVTRDKAPANVVDK